MCIEYVCTHVCTCIFVSEEAANRIGYYGTTGNWNPITV